MRIIHHGLESKACEQASCPSIGRTREWELRGEIPKHGRTPIGNAIEKKQISMRQTKGIQVNNQVRRRIRTEKEPVFTIRENTSLS